MAERHHRVDQLRLEAGVPPSPESVEVRHARLIQMQMESLGTKRRDFISTHDYGENRVSAASIRTIDASRLSNQPGTEEFRSSQENQGALLAWNKAYLKLEADGTLEEDLQDINRGQTHRLKLMGDQSVRNYNDVNVQDSSRHGGSGLRGDRPRGSNLAHETDRPHGTANPPRRARGTDHPRKADRLQGTDRARTTESLFETNRPRVGLARPRGGRGGRGGGHVGNHNRGSRLGRTPTGYSSNLSPVSPNLEESHASEVLHTSHKESLKAGRHRSSQPELSSLEDRLDDEGEAPSQIVAAVAAPATTRPVSPKWGLNLASPEAFMAAMYRGSPAPLAKSAIATVPESGQDIIAPDVARASEVGQNEPGLSRNEVEQPNLRDSAGGNIDTLISTSVETELGNIHSLTPERNPPFSYSKDLLGLELGGDSGSSAAEHDDEGKTLGERIPQTENPLSRFMAHLAQILPAIREQLRPDSVAHLDEILEQLRGKNLEPPSSAATYDTNQVIPKEQPSTANAVHDLPKDRIEGTIFTAASSETKQLIPTEQPSTIHGFRDLPVNKVEKHSSTAASSIASTVWNQSKPQGNKDQEMSSRQARLSRRAEQEDIRSSLMKESKGDMIIGTHLMPGQLHRLGSARSNPGSSALDRSALPQPSVTDSTANPNLALLTLKFDELHLSRAGPDETVQDFAAINTYGLTPSSSAKPTPASTKAPFMGPFNRGDSSLSAVEQSSAIHSDKSQHSGDFNNISAHTKLNELGVSSASGEPSPTPPFIHHGSPARSPAELDFEVFMSTLVPTGPSQINRTGLFREENQDSRKSPEN
ncbi:hypothetical protein MMC07_009192 [Pseudocyphellaria aurata]|nr:hypothetical protein [Pseudocyphellaria aurata]